MPLAVPRTQVDIPARHTVSSTVGADIGIPIGEQVTTKAAIFRGIPVRAVGYLLQAILGVGAPPQVLDSIVTTVTICVADLLFIGR